MKYVIDVEGEDERDIFSINIQTFLPCWSSAPDIPELIVFFHGGGALYSRPNGRGWGGRVGDKGRIEVFLLLQPICFFRDRSSANQNPPLTAVSFKDTSSSTLGMCSLELIRDVTTWRLDIWSCSICAASFNVGTNFNIIYKNPHLPPGISTLMAKKRGQRTW